MFIAFWLLTFSRFPLDLLGSVLRCFEGVFGGSLGDSGVPGDPFGDSWGALWDHFGGSWVPLGSFLA